MRKTTIVCLMIFGLVLLISVSERGAVGQAKKEPIKVGLLIEKTGGLAAYGYSHERVMAAAVSLCFCVGLPMTFMLNIPFIGWNQIFKIFLIGRKNNLKMIN